MSELGPAAKLIDVDPTASEIYEQFYDLGWTDGLPIIPPKPDLNLFICSTFISPSPNADISK